MGVLEPQVRRALGAGRFVAAVVTVVVLAGEWTAAQAVLVAELQAAFLYNFARFVEWPADVMPAGAPLVLCVVNDGPVADALERTIRGRNVEGHDLIVRRIKTDEPLPTCHVLHLGGFDLKRSLDVIATVRDEGVFTVSDAARFAQAGGFVELFLQDGRMQIAVNVDALQRARVKLSSRVLGLAKIVRDAPAQ
jgi:hypothetical protein